MCLVAEGDDNCVSPSLESLLVWQGDVSYPTALNLLYTTASFKNGVSIFDRCNCVVYVRLLSNLIPPCNTRVSLLASPPSSSFCCVSAAVSQVQFGRLLREQAAAQSMFMDGLQKSFVEPMERYTQTEYGKLAENKKAWEATEEVYVAVRWCSLKGDEEGLASNVFYIVRGGIAC